MPRKKQRGHGGARKGAGRPKAGQTGPQGPQGPDLGPQKDQKTPQTPRPIFLKRTPSLRPPHRPEQRPERRQGLRQGVGPTGLPGLPVQRRRGRGQGRSPRRYGQPELYGRAPDQETKGLAQPPTPTPALPKGPASAAQGTSNQTGQTETKSFFIFIFLSLSCSLVLNHLFINLYLVNIKN